MRVELWVGGMMLHHEKYDNAGAAYLGVFEFFFNHDDDGVEFTALQFIQRLLK